MSDPRPDPELRYVSAETARAWFEAGLRVFNGDGSDEQWASFEPVLEPERSFGFAVGERWVSTCAAFTRQLGVPGGVIPAAAVTLVTVAPDFRRRRLLTRMMGHQLADVRDRGEAVAILWAAEAPIYGRFGYGDAVPRWELRGQTRSTTFRPGVALAAGSVSQVSVEEYRVAVPALREHLALDRPGALDRSAGWWDQQLWDPQDRRDGASALRFVVHRDASGAVDGYAQYRVKDGWTAEGPDAEVRIVELEAVTVATRAALWRFLLDLDLARRFRLDHAPFDEPLRRLVANTPAVRSLVGDSLYVRLVDVRAALGARAYASELDVVIGVEDPVLPHNTGAYRLQVGADGVRVTKARRRADLTLGVRELGAIYLGGTALTELALAGFVTERTAGSVAAVSRAFGWHRRPFCPDHF